MLLGKQGYINYIFIILDGQIFTKKKKKSKKSSIIQHNIITYCIDTDTTVWYEDQWILVQWKKNWKVDLIKV